VSRVLNNATVVKTTTRARVMKAIEELRYYPNLHARSLAGGKSRTIGVIVSNIENPFFFDIYKTMESDAHARGYELVMANTDYRSEQLVASIDQVGRRVAGPRSYPKPTTVEQAVVAAFLWCFTTWEPRKNITNIRVNYRRGMEKVVVICTAWATKAGFRGLSRHYRSDQRTHARGGDTVSRCSPRLKCGPRPMRGSRAVASGARLSRTVVVLRCGA
jgi:DNA-binding LacI/PurR family transcriptional regulator